MLELWRWHFHAKLQTGGNITVRLTRHWDPVWLPGTGNNGIISHLYHQYLETLRRPAVPLLITVVCLLLIMNSYVSAFTAVRREVVKNCRKKSLPVCCLFVFPLILAKLCYNLETIFTLRVRTTFFKSFNRRIPQWFFILENINYYHGLESSITENFVCFETWTKNRK